MKKGAKSILTGLIFIRLGGTRVAMDECGFKIWGIIMMLYGVFCVINGFY